MEPFKNRLHAGVVEDLARRIPGDWNREAFVRRATEGLEDLELKARVRQIAEALHDHLPADFPTAVGWIVQAVGEPPTHTDALTGDWGCWVLNTYVELYGLDHPARALDAMEHLTPHFSCEFALRPYFRADPDGVTARLNTWVRHPNPHLRRLASEGTRPRLPWGAQLRDRIERPERLLPLLTLLRDDPSPYVRRSVANHLNDIAKDHPELVLRVAAEWSPGASRERRRLVKHALRTLLKAGESRAYAVVGLLPFEGTAEVDLARGCIAIGSALEIRATLTAERRQRVRLDLGMHHLRADGSHGLKVFHWTERVVDPGTQVLVRRQPVRLVTTRPMNPGEHRFDVRINGEIVGGHAFFVEER